MSALSIASIVISETSYGLLGCNYVQFGKHMGVIFRFEAQANQEINTKVAASIAFYEPRCVIT
jgi:hypothetical protein